MSKILKTEDGIFIPRELITDFEQVEVDASVPGLVVIRSKAQKRPSEVLLERIDRRREAIFQRRGLLDDSAALIREGREQELE